MAKGDDTPTNPVVIFAPYLRLVRAYEFADWWLGPVDAYVGRWFPSRLRTAARQLLRRFVDVDRHPVTAPTLIASRTAGVGGDLPLPDTIAALTLAVQFGTLAANPTWKYKPGDEVKAVALENVDIWFQPVDLAERFISLQRGTRVKMLGGGHRFNDRSLRIPPPLELPPQRTAAFDPAIASAVYSVLTDPPEGSDLAVRLRPTIRWWLKAWSNNANVSSDDRILFLKTAIEALTGKSDTAQAASALTEMFRRVPATERVDLLWKEDEPSFPKTPDTGGPNPQPALTHFICNFGYQRNRIIHDGAATTLTYVQDGSEYSGHFVDVADRIVREAVLVALDECGYPDLWRSAAHREIRRLLTEGHFEFDGLVYNVIERPTDGGWSITVKELPDITAIVDDTACTVPVITAMIAVALGVDEDSFTVYAWPEFRPDPSDLSDATGTVPD